MAVVPTGEIFKTLKFAGQSSGNYGVYITGEAVYNAPARDVEMVTIPGRNGQLALDKGRFENIEVSYPAGIFADNEADFAQAVSDFRNFLASRSGYRRLEDDYNPNEYRMAVYKSGLEVDPKLLRAGEFNIVFDCKPQRWLKDGETAVTIGEWGETETASGDIVTVENEDGVLAVKSLGVDLEPIQDLHGYDKPWVGGAGKNKLPNATASQTISGVTFTANADGTVTANGTATASADYYFVGASGVYDYVGNIITGSYRLSGNLLGGDTSTLFIVQEGGTILAQQTDGNDATVTLDSTKKYRIFIRVNSGKTLSNQKYYPMIRLASETDATFAPYENICPISGTSEVDVYVSNDNLITARENWFTNASGVIEYYTNYHAVVFPVQQGKTYSVLIEQAVTPNRIYAFYEDYPQVGSVSYNRSRVTSAPTTLTAPIDGWCVYRDVPQNTFVSVVLGSTPRSAEEAIVYTSELGRTVYGGTLDVTSGVLTVTHGYTKFTASDNWLYRNPSGFYIADDSFALAPDTTDFYYKSDMYGQTNWATKADKCISAYSTSSRAFIIFDSRFTSVTDFKAAMPQEGIQVWYSLAEPQTYQLTAQQIELLTGTNNIWSDSGDVTVEYGQDPSVLFNPTRFESSPLLRIWGYGTVGFNGYEIELENDVLGNIVLLDAQTRAVAGTSTKLPQNLMNVGDSFTLDASSFFWAFSFDSTRIAYVKIRSVSDSNSSQFRSEKAGNGYYTNVSPLDFVYGTESTISNISTIQATYTDRDNHTGTFTSRLFTQIHYDAEAGRLTYTRNISQLPGTWLSMDYKSNLSTRGQVVGDSTVSVLGHPTFIDCDLGEAYKYAGPLVSLNRYVDLGSDLPTLAPGKNEITYDDTITQVRIVPNWWKL